jgi:hypothetical protein
MAQLIDVRPMPRGGFVATCDCGAHRTYEHQVEAWDWVAQHRCGADEQDATPHQHADHG